MLDRTFRNLAVSSHIHRALERFLLSRGEPVGAEEVCQAVMLIRPPNASVARVLVEGLCQGDWRFQLDDAGRVTLKHEDPTEVWQQRKGYAVVDVEATTGRKDHARIIEVAVCRIEDGKIVRHWSSLVNPGRPVARWVEQLTGITDEMVRAAPTFEELASKVAAELEDMVIVAHQARFDLGCLNAEFERLYNLQLTNGYLCTLELARKFFPGLEDYRLGTISSTLRVAHEQPHRAESDALATAGIFCRLVAAEAEGELERFLRPRPPSVRRKN
jgi:DNA polymerase III epsilon subunit family exonuclease